MKSDEDVRMISAEVPVLFAKVSDSRTGICHLCSDELCKLLLHVGL